MEKTSEEIEADVYRLVKASSLMDMVGGKIYRDEQRPKDARTEDIVVKFQTGTDGQVQEGYVLVHVYIPDIQTSKDGELKKDTSRVKKIAVAVNGLVEELGQSTEYLFEKDGTPKSWPSEDGAQHFINLRLHYRRITF